MKKIKKAPESIELKELDFSTRYLSNEKPVVSEKPSPRNITILEFMRLETIRSQFTQELNSNFRGKVR